MEYISIILLALFSCWGLWCFRYIIGFYIRFTYLKNNYYRKTAREKNYLIQQRGGVLSTRNLSNNDNFEINDVSLIRKTIRLLLGPAGGDQLLSFTFHSP